MEKEECLSEFSLDEVETITTEFVSEEDTFLLNSYEIPIYLSAIDNSSFLNFSLHSEDSCL